MKAFTFLAKLFLTTMLVLTIFIPNEASASTEDVELDILDIEDIQGTANPSYSDGRNPSITALDNGNILSVFEGQTDNTLYYRLGVYKDGMMSWDNKNIKYGEGKLPEVTVLDNGEIIEMHEHATNGSITYSLGRYEDGEIDWYSTDNQYILRGEAPSVVTLDDGVILTVYLDDATLEGLRYSLGVYEDGSIKKISDVRVVFDKELASNRSVTVLDNGEILVTQESASGELYYSLGTYNGGLTIDWFDRSWTKYSDGRNPYLTVLDNGHVLNVYEGQVSDKLYYRLGEFKDDDINWYSDQIHYSTGKNPSLTVLDNGDILGLREEDKRLYYDIGKYEDGSIVWVSNPERDVTPNYYATGDSPAITVLDNGKVVAIHHWKGELHYQIGTYLDDEIQWSNGTKYDSGKNPTITTLPNGDIIEIHNGSGIFNHKNIYYNLGRYENNKINWYSIGNKYDTGFNPSVTILENGKILEIHETDHPFTSTIHYNVGEFKGEKIEWISIGNKYGEGQNPSVTTLNNGRILETHRKNGSSDLFYGAHKIASNGINLISSGYVNYQNDATFPAMIQLNNGYILSLFQDKNNTIWERLGEFGQTDVDIDWLTNTSRKLVGSNNELAVLQDGTVLNVRQDKPVRTSNGGGAASIENEKNDTIVLWYNLGRYENGEFYWIK